MMKTLILSVCCFVCLNVLFTNCTSNQKTDAEKSDSLKTAASKQSPNANNKFFIAPPDTSYTGDYIDKYPNGIIKFTGFFRFGKRHGHWMAFYDNGIKWSECFYDNGKKHGASIVYFPDGTLQYSGWYKNDLRDSIWVFYDATTGKEVEAHTYRNDEETGIVDLKTLQTNSEKKNKTTKKKKN